MRRLSGGPQKDMSMFQLSESLKVTLFGKRVFSDVIKLTILRWGHSGWSGWATKSNDGSPHKKQKRRHRRAWGGHLKTEQKLNLGGYKPKKAWNHQTVKTAKKAPPCRSLEEAQPCQHLNFRLLASRAVREYISTAWSLPVSYNLLQNDRKLRYNTTKQIIYILLLLF